MTNPDFTFEIESNCKLVAGVDEAGRGPLCGPVVAAAVIFKSADVNSLKLEDKETNNSKLQTSSLCALRSANLINDSKKMSARQREKAYEWIMANCIVGVGQCSPAEIDQLNILWASMTAMQRAIDALPVRPEFVLADGNRLPDGVHGRCIVKGDSKSISIAAASIVAKVTRDKIMSELAAECPWYGWDKNAGYPTAAHLQAIKIHGINSHYRKTFGPVRKVLGV
jgi:ribonuclease HII